MDSALDVPAANDVATPPASDAPTALMTSLSVADGGHGATAALAAKHEQSDATMTAPPPKKRKFAHTNEAQRRVMLEWLERPGNFQLLASRSGSTTVNGKKIKKTDGFRALMRHVNLHTGASWSMDITKSRFESFLTSYRKVKRQAQQPQFALTENDRARGITSVAQKLNALCVFFDRIDALHEAVPANEPFVPQHPAPPGNSDHESPVESVPVVDSTLSGADTPPLHDSVQGDHASPETSPQAGAVDEHRDEPPTHTPGLADASTTEMEATSDPSLAPAAPDELALQQLALERERLDLLQEQLAVQQRELELKARALQQQEDDKRRAMRAELAAKLAQAGKSVAEIKELLELIM